jgi:hypothetical protein
MFAFTIDCKGLYRKFVNSASPNFRGWLRQHTAEANATLYEGYVDALCRMDVAKGIFNGQHTQVEVCLEIAIIILKKYI